MGYGKDRDVRSVTIASGASLSDEINTGGKRIIGIIMPSAWTAASITFASLVARDDATSPPTDTYGKVQDASGTEVTVTTPAASVYISLAATAALEGLGRVKIRSGVAATPVNQGGDRVLQVVLID